MVLIWAFVSLILSIVSLIFLQPAYGAGYCDGKADGNYRDPDNCYGYIACSNQIVYKMSCSSGLKYNEKLDQCDWPENVQCSPVDGGWSDWSVWGPCTVTCGGGTQARNRSCTNPPPSNGGKKCTGPDTETQQCQTMICPFDCTEKPDGNYKDPNNCFGFIACSNGIAHQMNCPHDLKYNEKKDICDWPENVTC
ncbi:probable endochitinase [Pocillopora verrucosa]|uniref:probable endochitinase n=1 Tax=Pocillopora verrucosa TaxID=203993 RepID=UPI00333F18F2